MLFFEWDEAKAESNLRKHGISFDDAMTTFEDPGLLLEQDRVVDGEVRWQAIGMSAGVVLLLTAHTIEEEGEDAIVRIVSARRVTRPERRRYGKDREKNAW